MNDYHHFKFTPSVWLVPALMLILMWFVFFFEHSFNINLTSHGILPRTASGLQGILFSPFLHGGLNHIASNSIPLFILTTALIYFYRDISLKVLFYGVLLSGLITWIIGRQSYHIGASSLIYVLVSFIFFKGMMTQYYRLMALSLTVVMLYGGMIWYVFPEVDHQISWEGHLAGLITGFFFAVRFKTPDYVKAIQYPWEKPDFDPMQDAFMKRFDENGNFVNPPPPEDPINVLEQDQPAKQTVVINLSPIINYSYAETKEDNKNTNGQLPSPDGSGTLSADRQACKTDSGNMAD